VKTRKKTLTASTVQHDFVYTGTTFTGEVREESTGAKRNIVFDTGSDWLVIQKSWFGCMGCELFDNYISSG
jgi:hypothetical protein